MSSAPVISLTPRFRSAILYPNARYQRTRVNCSPPTTILPSRPEPGSWCYRDDEPARPWERTPHLRQWSIHDSSITKASTILEEIGSGTICHCSEKGPEFFPPDLLRQLWISLI